MRNNFINGRIPQILPCTHLMCEECLIHMAKFKIITCKLCKINTELEGTTNLRDKFPTDSYVLGSLLKRNISERVAKNFDRVLRYSNSRSMNFQPAGSSLQNARRSNYEYRNTSRILNQDTNVQTSQDVQNPGK